MEFVLGKYKKIYFYLLIIVMTYLDVIVCGISGTDTSSFFKLDLKFLNTDWLKNLAPLY